MLADLTSHFTFDTLTGLIAGAPVQERRLSDLHGYFANEKAYAALLPENPLLYTVAHAEPDHREGALHFAITCLYPGRVGAEYYMTKGHYHRWRPAAEYYMTLHGEGLLLLEETEGNCRAVPMVTNGAAYVPGHTAHRTMNTGSEPLVFLGIYPAQAGQDYAPIVASNFRQVVVAVENQPTVMARADYLMGLAR
jgi:glucose-6-phosphate isomerase